MKICSECNTQCPEDTRFCPECGSEVQSTTGGRSQQKELLGRVFFGEYTIVDRLGEGGMGEVYLAEQNSIDQKIALKVLHAETAESDEIIQRFHREAKVISMLSHPNIVRVFIFGRTEDDLLFLAMEYVDGVELRSQLDGTPMDELKSIKIMKQVCSALAAAHDLGIIHRDLKPENILLTDHRGEENFVKILDFGIAKIKHPEGQQGPQLTQAGIVYGTPEYLSPEQAQAEDLDNRTDIYALGCILFEMMTGRVPFRADASVEILKSKVFEDPPRPSDYGNVAPTMEQIIMRAMAKDRDNRFSDALEMFDALVARENEIQHEQQLDESETYVPGSELTGVHRAVDPSENPIPAVQQQAAAAKRASQSSTGGGGGPAAVAGGDLEVDEVGEMDATVNMDRPSPEQLAAGAPPGENPDGAPFGGRSGDANQSQQFAAGEAGSKLEAGNPGVDQDAPTRPDREKVSPEQNQDTFVRYALIGAVIVLALAVVGLAGYLVYMLAYAS